MYLVRKHLADPSARTPATRPAADLPTSPPADPLTSPTADPPTIPLANTADPPARSLIRPDRPLAPSAHPPHPFTSPPKRLPCMAYISHVVTGVWCGEVGICDARVCVLFVSSRSGIVFNPIVSVITEQNQSAKDIDPYFQSQLYVEVPASRKDGAHFIVF